MSTTPLPEDVLVDTSLIVEAINRDSTNAAAAISFCDQMVEERCRVHFSQILRLELTEAVRKLATIEGRVSPGIRQEFQLDEWEHSPFVRRRWMQFGVQEFESLLARFAAVFEIAFNRGIWLSSIAVMTDERLRSHDAIHVATAREYQVPCIATTDEHFLRVQNVDVRLIRDTPVERS